MVAQEIKDSLIALEKKLDSREKKLTADNRPIEKIVSKAMNDIVTIIEKSKQKRRQWIQIKFFPEHATMEYYKLVYGKVLLCLDAIYCIFLIPVRKTVDR